MTLRAQLLTSKSGGRTFLNPDEKQIEKDVSIMDSHQRSQYRLEFAPADLHRDGSFHHIGSRCSVPGSLVLVRSGYYDVKRNQ